MTTLLFLAMGIGLVPNDFKAKLNTRTKLCENLALQLCSVPEEDLPPTFETIAPAIVDRNQDILSLGIRDADGNLVTSTQQHQSLWQEASEGQADVNQVQIPFYYGQEQAGTLEIYLTPLVSKGLYGYLQSANPPFILFMIFFGYLAYRFYLKKTLHHLNPSSVIPKRVKAVLDTLSECVVMADNEERIVFANEAFTKAISQPESKILGHKLSLFPWVQQQYDQKSDTLPWTQTLQGASANKNIPLLLKKTESDELISLVNSTPIIGVNGEQRGIMASFTDITELEQKNKELIKISRSAGMAEVATNVLHNVGNVLNNINTSASLIDQKVSELKLTKIRDAVKIMYEHLDGLGAFLTMDERGKHIPSYLMKTTEQLTKDQQDISEKVQALRSSIEHIKEIIRTQQSYARTQIVETPTSIRNLIKDAIEIDISLKQYGISVISEFAGRDNAIIDKARLMQIIVNLIHNARDALVSSDTKEKTITIHTDLSDNNLKIEVTDNGIGIEPDQLTKIFRHGFTTKATGSGFGLHSSALAAKELGGSLIANSKGKGYGATFTLEIPIWSERKTDAASENLESTNISH